MTKGDRTLGLGVAIWFSDVDLTLATLFLTTRRSLLLWSKQIHSKNHKFWTSVSYLGPKSISTKKNRNLLVQLSYSASQKEAMSARIELNSLPPVAANKRLPSSVRGKSQRRRQLFMITL
ncbi:hypothetical protein J6590_071949 [Homalodisca vitripennis]|nr:hypothetical protein J6590_071949 [Homalodisca vitripennis]